MRISLQHIWIILVKEILDNLRDHRSLISSLAYSMIGPALMVGMIMVLGRTFINENVEKPLILPVIGAENAPGLIVFLGQNNVETIPGPSNPQEAVRNGEAEIVLIIPAEFGDEFTSGRPAKLQFVIDSTRQSALPKVERARGLLAVYERQIAHLRLLARGLSPDLINPVAVEQVDVATPQTQAMIFLNMMPYFVVLTVFVGGMHVVLDGTAGERERGSLEPLLINPVRRRDLVAGKQLAAIPFAAIALFFTLFAFAIAFTFIPLEDYIGFQLSLDPLALTAIFLIALPMVFLATALQMLIASYARSFKEAQTYVAFLPLVPALPGLLLAFLPVKPGLANMLVPTLGQQIIINQLMRGEPVNPVYVLVSVGATQALSLALTWAAVKLYQRERIVLGAK